MMTVRDFCSLCTDPAISYVDLYTCDACFTIFRGTMRDALRSEFCNWNVESYDATFANNRITLNISEP